MAHQTVYSMTRKWNELRLCRFSRRRATIFPRQPDVFAVTALARSTDGWTIPVKSELTDEAFLFIAEEEGHFDFLDDPAEDIYTWDDGDEP